MLSASDLYAVVRAKKDGHLVPASSCMGCGVAGGTCKRTRLQGHHDDYARPLDVRWLCAKCHSLEHAMLNLRACEPSPLRDWLLKTRTTPSALAAAAKTRCVRLVLAGYRVSLGVAEKIRRVTGIAVPVFGS